ncbi:hypothetical protein CSOJ01_00886 [Colletotrichum sojae]|uniref:Uncharacterized protein n=1 Tax=Colletotrichum sojae TaxID=2175907 RepID=A0A8H6JWB6_9PEZI|nr:hypothetical protein CSOJ01_00886 [Colletotrichum sojae]
MILLPPHSTFVCAGSRLDTWQSTVYEGRPIALSHPPGPGGWRAKGQGTRYVVRRRGADRPCSTEREGRSPAPPLDGYGAAQRYPPHVAVCALPRTQAQALAGRL